MAEEFQILIFTAASVAFLHTLMGPDHYLPFIVMARARTWSVPKTLWITFLCGIGHVGSSIVLGVIGIALGVAVHKLELLESLRGNLAAWALIGFGLAYFLWGVRQAVRNKPHSHGHVHEDGTFHVHPHRHQEDHVHIHLQENAKKTNITPWVLFTIFVLGPCEPLIPILMYPAAKNSWTELAAVSAVFGTITVATMLAIVTVSVLGINMVPVKKLERYTHALAGFTIFASGMAIQFLGL